MHSFHPGQRTGQAKNKFIKGINKGFNEEDDVWMSYDIQGPFCHGHTHSTVPHFNAGFRHFTSRKKYFLIKVHSGWKKVDTYHLFIVHSVSDMICLHMISD